MNRLIVLFMLFSALLMPGWAISQMKWESLMLMKAAAEKGNPEAQFLIGQQYLVGDGIDKDRVEATKWLRKAAESGHAEAQYALGNLYATTDLDQGQADWTEMEKWLTMAAEQGNLAAISRLSDEEEKRLQSAVEHGDPTALARLGAFRAKNPIKRRYYTQENFLPVDPTVLSNGNTAHTGESSLGNPVPDASSTSSQLLGEDPAETIRWSLLLSGLRGADAFVVRGFMLENGIVVNRDLVAAADSYRKAAKLENALGQYRLGLMYAEGRGVTRDLIESSAWLSQAAKNGSVAAADELAKLKSPLSPEPDVAPKSLKEVSNLVVKP